MNIRFSSIKSILGGIGLACCSLLILLLIMECVLALFWPHRITTTFYNEQYDPVMGWVNRPNVSGKVMINKTSGEYFFRKQNSKGIRSPRDISYEKKAGVKRVLLIGDSYLFGHGVNDEDVVSEVLQRLTGEKIEIINGSVIGYGTDQVLLWLVHEGFKYKPDVVVYGFFPGNDLQEIATSERYDYLKPYFTLDNGTLTLNGVPVPDSREERKRSLETPDSIYKKAKKFLRHNSNLYQMVVERLNSLPSVRAFFLSSGIAEEYADLYNEVPEYLLNDEKQMLEIIKALFVEMNKSCEANNARFVLTFIPSKEENPAFPVGYGRTVGYDEDKDDIALLYEWNSNARAYFQAYSHQKRIEFLDLLPVVRKAHQEKQLFFYRGSEDHHWSAIGHSLAAEAIYGRLKQTGFID